MRLLLLLHCWNETHLPSLGKLVLALKSKRTRHERWYQLTVHSQRLSACKRARGTLQITEGTAKRRSARTNETGSTQRRWWLNREGVKTVQYSGNRGREKKSERRTVADAVVEVGEAQVRFSALRKQLGHQCLVVGVLSQKLRVWERTHINASTRAIRRDHDQESRRSEAYLCNHRHCLSETSFVRQLGHLRQFSDSRHTVKHVMAAKLRLALRSTLILTRNRRGSTARKDTL